MSEYFLLVLITSSQNVCNILFLTNAITKATEINVVVFTKMFHVFDINRNMLQKSKK